MCVCVCACLCVLVCNVSPNDVDLHWLCPNRLKFFSCRLWTDVCKLCLFLFSLLLQWLQSTNPLLYLHHQRTCFHRNFSTRIERSIQSVCVHIFSMSRVIESKTLITFRISVIYPGYSLSLLFQFIHPIRQMTMSVWPNWMAPNHIAVLSLLFVFGLHSDFVILKATVRAIGLLVSVCQCVKMVLLRWIVP